MQVCHVELNSYALTRKEANEKMIALLKLQIEEVEALLKKEG